MSTSPASVQQFLSGRRFAVAGVSRQTGQAANAVFRKLKQAGYDVVPVNPHASELEGVPCYRSVTAIPHQLDGVVIATAPAVAANVVRQCADHGVRRVWFHRSFGNGSVSEDAVRACQEHGITPIVGGCPLMFCEPVDVGHRCMRWWLQRQGRVPA
ncbi:MAG: CoA-binding protein [Vicinamibacterales bacterium]